VVALLDGNGGRTGRAGRTASGGLAGGIGVDAKGYEGGEK